MKKFVIMLAIVSLLLASSIVKAGYNEEKIKEAQTPKKQSEFLIDLTDNTEKYKGQTITLPLFVSSIPLFADGKHQKGDSLREWVGSDVDFWNGNFKIRISIPKSLSVPNAAHADFLIVTFVCEKGHLKSGNRAISIKRP